MRDVERLKGHNLEDLLSLLDAEFDVSSSGKLSSQNIGASKAFEAVAVTVLTQKEFDPQLSEIDQYELIKKAIRDTLASGELNATRLRAGLHRAEQSLVNQVPQLFTVVTSLSTPFRTELARRAVGDCRITLGEELPARYCRDHDRLVDETWTVNDFRRSPAYSAVRITCPAITANAAIDKALDAMNFIRGIWNWERNRSVIRLARKHWVPPNDLVLGPFHTCHYNNGDLASDSLWYEDYAFVAVPPSHISLPWNKLLEAEAEVRKIVRRSPHGERLMKTFNRYSRALDSYSPSTQFIRLWSLLEYLVALGRGERSDVIGERASFPSPRGSDRHHELEALAVFRNQVVHEAVESNYENLRVTQLRKIVEHLIAVWLGPCSQLDTLDDVRSFLDLPRDAETLRKRVGDLHEQIRLRHEMMDLLAP